MSELKKCPFCGSEAEYHNGSVKDACLCSNEMCLLFARLLDVKLWNTRPIEDALQAENESLKEFARDVARGQLQMPSEKFYIEHVVYNANKILKESKQ